MTKLKSILLNSIFYIIMMSMGAFIGRYIGQSISEPWELLWLFPSFILGFYLQIMVHEAGHLVFGLLTGYRFLSFRVASLMLLKTPEGLRFKRYHIPGTGGQCILEPPHSEDSQKPFILMLAGGVIANALFTLILWLMRSSQLLPDSLTLPIILMGLIMIVMNGIPYKSVLPNDAYTIYEFSRHKELLTYFYKELLRYKLSLEGLSYAQMPEQLFDHPRPDQLDKTAYQSSALAYLGRLSEQEKYEETLTYGLELLNEPKLLPIFKPLISTTVIICQLLLDQPVTVTIDKKGEQILKAFEKHETAISTYRYAVALLETNDSLAADKALANFEKLAQKSFLAGNIAAERRLIANITAHSRSKVPTDTVQH